MFRAHTKGASVCKAFRTHRRTAPGGSAGGQRGPWGAGGVSVRAVAGLAVLVALLAALLAAAPAAHAQGSANVYRIGSAQKAGRFVVPISKSETFKVDREFGQVVIGDAEIADVVPLSNRSVYVLGKKIGTTNLSIYDASKNLLAVMDIEVSPDLPALRRQLNRNVAGSVIRVSSLNGRIMLSGTVPSAVALKRAITIAKQYAPKDITNNLSIGRPQQVMLEVRFVEAFRSAGRELGFRWDAVSNGFTAGVGIAGFVSNNQPFGTFLGRLLDNGVRVDLIIRALEQKGLARRLAEPNLIALSGDTASFLAGGEFPFPVQADNNQITIEFKTFGVGLAFTPTVLADGMINLKIEPEVSQLDPINSLRLNNVQIPSLIVRRAKTTVELRDGQSFAIAGLLQTNSTKDHQQLPWISSVPVLGSLFKSSSFLKQETDLVIIVTPRLVRPAKPGQRLATPLDATVPTGDLEYFATGRPEKKRIQPNFGRPTGTVTGPYGHILDIGGDR